MQNAMQNAMQKTIQKREAMRKSLIEQSTPKSKIKSVSYRLNEDVVAEFRKMCKIYNVKQVAVIENAMKMVIDELRERK